jgi:hypothetical protein
MDQGSYAVLPGVLVQSSEFKPRSSPDKARIPDFGENDKEIFKCGM